MIYINLLKKNHPIKPKILPESEFSIVRPNYSKMSKKKVTFTQVIDKNHAKTNNNHKKITLTNRTIAIS